MITKEVDRHLASAIKAYEAEGMGTKDAMFNLVIWALGNLRAQGVGPVEEFMFYMQASAKVDGMLKDDHYDLKSADEVIRGG